MTRFELLDTLDQRIGWRQSPITGAVVIDGDNATSESGRFFQDEHSFVRVSTIKELMEEAGADDAAVNAYLSQLRKNVVLNVIDEVFDEPNFPDVDLEDEPNLFDSAISRRMVMKLLEIAETSTRSNRTERNIKDMVQKLFFDVNGDPNFPQKQSIQELYNKELEYLRGRFDSGTLLEVVTLM